MVEYKECDVVRVAKLRSIKRSISGSAGIKRQPKVGDVGTITTIAFGKSGQIIIYTVECVDDKGYTVWLSDFELDEIELLKTKSD